MGSPWLPADIIDDFMLDMLGDPLAHVYFYSQAYKEELKDGVVAKKEKIEKIGYAAYLESK